MSYTDMKLIVQKNSLGQTEIRYRLNNDSHWQTIELTQDANEISASIVEAAKTLDETGDPLWFLKSSRSGSR